MKTKWSRTWKSSVQPRKQRKYVANAPLHIKRKFSRSHLSKELMKKHKTRSVLPVSGDTAKIVRGSYKGKQGKIEKVDVKNSRVYITGVEYMKKDGNTIKAPVNPSNIIITSLNLADKKRGKRLEAKE